MYGFFKLPISDKKMSKVMYALLRTTTSTKKPLLCFRVYFSILWLWELLCVEVDEHKIKLFEELAEVKLQTSEEFQGKIAINLSSTKIFK